MPDVRAAFRNAVFSAVILTAVSGMAWASCSGTSTSQTCTSGAISETVNAGTQGATLSQAIPANTLTGPVTHVAIGLTGISESGPDNLSGMELLLVAPDGTQLVFLAFPGDAVNTAPSAINVDDTGTNYCNATMPTGTQHVLATNCSGQSTLFFPNPDGFTVSAPGSSCTSANCAVANPPSKTMDNTFSAVANANGTWSLYVVNNANFTANSFSFTGWTLTVTTSGVAASSTTTTLSGAASVTRTPPAAGVDTITATVTSTGTVNGGTVSFFDNGNAVTCTGGNQTVASGTATCQISFTQEGTHPITANYSGTTGFAASTSNTFNVTVSNNTTSTNVTPTTGTFCNQGNINIPATGSSFGVAGPYPSQIFVGTNGSPSLNGAITNLTIDLKSIQHQQTDSPSLLLVSPLGTPYMLFADIGAGASGPGNVTLADGHAAIASFSTGTVSPADNHASASLDQGVFPAPAPQTGFLFPNPLGASQPAGPTTIGQAFNGAGANGTWQLYVLNDAGGTGSIGGGWCLNFTVNPNQHPTTTTVTNSPTQSYTTAPFTSKFPPTPASDFVTLTSHTSSDVSVTIGSVTFTDAGNNITCAFGTSNPATVDASGNAVCKTTFPTEGNHIVKATYHDVSSNFGDSNNTALERVDSHSTRAQTGSVTYNYCNPGQIRIPGFSTAFAPANPYPSNIFINDLPGTINKVGVSIPNFTVQNVAIRDITSMLVGPNQTSADSLDFFSHVGTNAGAFTASYSFLDGSAAMNQSVNPGSGTYAPTSLVEPGGGALPTYPSLSPAGPYPPPPGTPNYAATNGASTFNSIYGSGVANTRLGAGTWSLFQQSTVDGTTILEGNGTNQPGWCLNFTVNPPVVTVTKADGGLHFHQGQLNAQYTVTVANQGPGPTGGTLTVTDTLTTNVLTPANPSGSGTDWTCNSNLQVITCTNSDVIVQGGSYPTLTLKVNVDPNAPTTVSNSSPVTGGGTVGTTNSNNNTALVTTIDQVAHLTVTKVHVGTNFVQGQQGSYTITVNNSNAGGPTTGNVQVEDILPTGLSFASFTGTGWNCVNTSGDVVCTYTPVINAGASSNALTLTVNVASNAPMPTISNTATVSGGGTFAIIVNATGSDTVNVAAGVDLTVSKTHNPSNFIINDLNDQINVSVANGGVSSTNGATITVTDTLPTGLTFNGTPTAGWSCNANGSNPVICTSTTSIAGSGGTLALTLNVNVASSTSSPLTNNVSVACSCAETSTANNTNTDSIPVIQTVNVTLATVPSGLNISLDGGSTFASPHTYALIPGSSHTIATTSPQAGTPGTQFVFVSWSDAGAISHSVTVPVSNTTFTATFKTQYQLTTQVSPNATEGSISPATGFFDASSSVSVSATANTGYVFTGFSGALTGTTNPQNVTMSGPLTVTANFQEGPTSIGALVTGKSGPSNARVWTISLHNNGPGVADNVTITGMTFTVTLGSACTPVVTLPSPIATIPPSSTATAAVTIDFTPCASGNRYRVTMPFTANSGAVNGTMTLNNQLQ